MVQEENIRVSLNKAQTTFFPPLKAEALAELFTGQ